MLQKEWDEYEEEKISFGDRVETSDGEVGRVTELDEDDFYCVYGTFGLLGWYHRENIKKVPEEDTYYNRVK